MARRLREKNDKIALLVAKSGGRATDDVTLHCGAARVGFVQKRLFNQGWFWELHLISDATRGHPRGASDTRDAAIREASRTFDRWLRAAGLERKS